MTHASFLSLSSTLIQSFTIMASQRTSWNVQSSTMAQSAHNPIRQIVDKLKLDPQATKSFISLSVGDPTIFGNFNIDDSANEAVIRQLKTFKHNGYPPAHGNKEKKSRSKVHVLNHFVLVSFPKVLWTLATPWPP